MGGSGDDSEATTDFIMRLCADTASLTYHYRQDDDRTELYHFRIIFGISWSVIAKLTCFGN